MSPQITSDFPQTDGGVGTDTGLFVVGRLRKVLQQLPIDRAIGELGDDCQHRFNSLLPYYRCDIRETGDLLCGISRQVYKTGYRVVKPCVGRSCH